MKLNEPLSLPTCSTLFPLAGDPGAILPVAIGDFFSAEANGSDRESGGMLPAVLIDVTTWTYALHYGRGSQTPPDVYVEDVLQNPSVYAYNPMADFGVGSTGVNSFVTTITFNTDPGGRDISWRGYGAHDGNGVLITNPIRAIEYVFTTFGNWQASDFDPATTAEAIRRMDGHGYPMHWLFHEHRTYREWLTDIAGHYYLDVPETHQGRLAAVLDEIVRVDSGRIVAQLDASTDVAGENPEDAIEWDLDRRNLCNSLTVRYQYAWSGRASSDPFTAQQTFTHESSISLYGGRPGGIQHREYLLPGIRTQAHLDAWVALFFARYALLPAMVRFPVKTRRYLAAMPSNYVTLTWRAGPSRDGLGWHDRILKVLNTGIDFDTPQMPLACLDTGIDFEVESYALMLDGSAGVWYLSPGVYGEVQLAQVNPGVEAFNATAYSWIQLTSPNGTVRYVQPTTLGAWSITSGQPAGNGTTDPVFLVSRDSTRWRLRLTNSPFTVIFLGEPRQLPFGAQTPLTEVLGRFRLDFNVLA